MIRMMVTMRYLSNDGDGDGDFDGDDITMPAIHADIATKDDDYDDDDIDKVEGVEVEEAYRVDGDTRPQDVRVRLALSSSSSS